MPPSPAARPSTLAQLRADVARGALTRRPVKDEIRENLIARLRAGEPLFPGIIGYDDTVVPQIVNAVLSRHNFILLGLRGQAKSRILRALTMLLDEAIPVVPGCEIHDDPLAPICAACRARVEEEGDALAIDWLGRDNSFGDGVILLTGTGIVPPDDFSLAAGDRVAIDISGIGQLANPVE